MGIARADHFWHRPSHRRPVRAALVAVALALVGTVAGPAPPGVADGLGISPVVLEYGEALRGGTYTRSLTLTNDDTATPLVFTVTPTGAVADWLTTALPDGEPTDEFVVPPQGSVTVKVRLTVPADAANGSYEGALEVLGADANASEGVGVQLGGLVLVEAEVTGTERRAASVVDFQVAPVEVGLDARFSAVVSNDGNVQVLAQLEVDIVRDGRPATKLTTAGEAWVVQPGATAPVTVEWATDEVAAGEYEARFRVADSAGGDERALGARSVSFRIEPRGTYTRAGEFTELRLVSPPSLDAPTLIEAIFTNTGRIETRAVFSGELRRGDALVDVVQSLERTVLDGRSATIGVAVDLDSPGTYVLDGIVVFDGFESNRRTLEFTVAAPGDQAVAPSAGGPGVPWPGIVAAAGGVALAAAGQRVWRRRRPQPAV